MSSSYDQQSITQGKLSKQQLSGNDLSSAREQAQIINFHNPIEHHNSRIPLLLRPNGVPVFSLSSYELDPPLNRQNSHENTKIVKAHNFTVGKSIQNTTELAVLDVKNSTAQEQSFPIKVLYVKPGIQKSQSLKKQLKNEQLVVDNKDINKNENNLMKNNGDLEVSMGEISGIFKQQRLTEQKKKSKSTHGKNKTAERRKLALKAYAEQIRIENLNREQTKKAASKIQGKDLPKAEEPEIQTEVKKRDVPHSQNRFQGQFENLHKELFTKAIEKLKEDQQKSQKDQCASKLKKEQEQQYLEEIKQRNLERVLKQKLKGFAPETLKYKEDRLKNEAMAQENNQIREKKRLQSAKSYMESRQMLALELVDKQKLQQFQEQKRIQQLQEKEAKKLQDHLNKQKEIQSAHTINRDLINFKDPSLNMVCKTKVDQFKVDTEEPDEEAQEIEKQKQKEKRRAILQEQINKRKQQEIEKKIQEEQINRKKQMQIAELDYRFQQQKEEFIKRKKFEQQMEQRKAEQRIRNARERAKSRTDKIGQLDELRVWIDQEMENDETKSYDGTIENNKFSEESPSKNLQSQKSQSPGKDHKNTVQKNKLQSNYPGNYEIEDQQKVRQNRYGVNGDNGYFEIVQAQQIKQTQALSLKKSLNLKQNVLDFTQNEASPWKSSKSEGKKSEDSYDKQPVKLEKRVLVNQPLATQHAETSIPGVLNEKDQVAKAKAEQLIIDKQATIVIQKWVRGWQDRKKCQKVRQKMQKEIDYNFSQFRDAYKNNDQFNINKYLSMKQKLRKQTGTQDMIEESISEQIIEQSGSNQQDYNDNLVGQTAESYIRSQILGYSSTTGKQEGVLPPMINNLFGTSGVKHMERDPFSLISIFARRNIIQKTSSPEQLIPEKDIPNQKEVKNKNRQSSQNAPSKAGNFQVQAPKTQKNTKQQQDLSKKKSKQKQNDNKYQQSESEEIEEEIMADQKNDKQNDEEYSDDFQSDHISESIPSFKDSGFIQLKEKQTTSQSIIEESIAESGPQNKPKSGHHRKQNTKEEISESIPSASIDDNYAEDMVKSSKSKDIDEISEESYLKVEDKRPSAPAKLTNSIKKPSIAEIPKKIDRIREKIEDDYENDGFESYSQSLRSQSLKKQQEAQEIENSKKYRQSKQIVDDFEERKYAQSENHKKILADFAQEFKRYEAAMASSIFVEQFQGIVSKSLAQKDILMLGQRLAQLEMENKHKQEIADIRAEQIRMMSQYMLLSAAGTQKYAGPNETNDNIIKQQSQIMTNIQKLIEKPIIIQREESILEKSAVAAKTEESARSKFKNEQNKIVKQQSIDESEIPEDVIESQNYGQSSDSIEESIVEQSKQSIKQLSNARRMLGSEQSVIKNSKDVLAGKKQKSKSVFEKNSFQNYTSGKFKDLLFNDGTMMEDFLTQIENTVASKSENQQKLLKKQLDSKQISPRTFSKKQKDLEKWIKRERNEIEQKRKKVKDTCQEIGIYLENIEKDNKIMQDGLNISNQSTPRGIGRSQSQVSVSGSLGLQKIQEQLDELNMGRKSGGHNPESKYINKKRQFVQQLVKEKKVAIEAGVRERMKNLENEVIDEMMQAALGLDVDKEIEKRVRLAQKMLKEDKIEESASKSVVSAGLSKSNKKNVKFQSPGDKYSSSGSFLQQHSESIRSQKSKSLISVADEVGDEIDESIMPIEESYGASISSQKNKTTSQKLVESSNNRSIRVSEQIKESDKEDEHSADKEENSLDRDENDQVTESIQSKNQNDKSDDGGYSEVFDDVSQSKSRGKSSKHKDDDESIEQSQQVDAEISQQEYAVEADDLNEELQSNPSQSGKSSKLKDMQNSPSESAKSIKQREKELNQQADQITEDIVAQLLQNFQQDNTIKMKIEDLLDESEFEDKWPWTLDKKIETPPPVRAQVNPVATPPPEEVKIEAIQDENKKRHDELMKRYNDEQTVMHEQQQKVIQYLDFIIQIVDKEILLQALQKPIEHDALKILEKIQAFDTEDDVEVTNMTYSQQQSALPAYLFDEIERRFEEIHPEVDNQQKNQSNLTESQGSDFAKVNPELIKEARNIHHLSIFDAFNEALDQERPYNVKGQPNPWSKQTRVTHENLSYNQVDEIIQKARQKVMQWNETGAGTKYAPPPPPPPQITSEYDIPPQQRNRKQTEEEKKAQEKQDEEERNKIERQERLGLLLTKEVHQRENDWLDYEIEDTQVRFDLADMILEELADEVTQFLIANQQNQ